MFDSQLMGEIVTPNEVAKRLGVTGLTFRNWLRKQKSAGHPLVASHGYRTRYEFTAAEADQLASEFTEQVLGRGVTNRSDHPRSAHPEDRRHQERRPRSPTKRDAAARITVEYPRSEDPGHRIRAEWMSEEVETLEDLLRSGLFAVAVGISPAPKSVAAGHYYQGNYGQTFFRRLGRAGLLPEGDEFEDDRAFAAGIGFTDVVKRPTPGQDGLRSGELEHGSAILEAKLAKFDLPLVIFVFKSAAETLLGPLPPYFYGLVPGRRLGGARVFVMPGPTVASSIESDAIEDLKRAVSLRDIHP